MRIINSENMPASNGHYSQCIEHNGILYLSGQLPIEKITKKIPETVEEQTRLTLTNIEDILKVAGSNRNDIIQVRIYISDIEMWDKVNKEYAQFFIDHKPVRSIVPTRDLHYGVSLEIEVIAVSKL